MPSNRVGMHLEPVLGEPDPRRTAQPVTASIENKPFLWGVATSGYQCEGGYNHAGGPTNNWHAWERSGTVEPTGAAVDFWNRYEADLETAAQAGLNAFRLGIEWARVQPSTTGERQATAPAFDEDALGHYARIVATCRRLGLEPIVTLHHFTHPAWLGPDAWLCDATVDHFERYVRHSVEAINHHLVHRHGVEPLRIYVTVNEPNILALNTYFARQFPAGRRGGPENLGQALSRLLAAHVRGRDAIRRTHAAAGWDPPHVGMTLYVTDVYWSSQMLFDLLELNWWKVPEHYAAEFLQSRANELEAALDAADIPRVWGGRVRSRIHRKITSRLTRGWFDDRRNQSLYSALRRVDDERQLDFLAIDYYDPFSVHAVRWPSFDDLSRGWRHPGELIWDAMSSKWWDWRPSPQGLTFFIRRLAQAFPDHPILIGENGLAVRQPRFGPVYRRRDGWSRSEFLRAHVAAVQHARAARLPVIGYLHWSLLDNYEWGTFTPRFGLLAIDYRTLERHRTTADGDAPLDTYAALLE